MDLFVGWDQSLNHGAVVVLAESGKVVGKRYYSDKPKWVKLGARDRISFRLPAAIKDEDDHDLRSILRIAWMRTFFAATTKWIASINLRPEAVYVAVEGYPFAMARGAHQIGEGGGVLRMALWDSGFRFRLHDPKTVKLFAAGAGDASKGEVLDAARAAGVDFADFGEGEGSPAEDLADAWALARMARVEQGVRRGRIKLEDLADHERQIFLRVTDHNPINLLSRPWAARPATIDPGWNL